MTSLIVANLKTLLQTIRRYKFITDKDNNVMSTFTPAPVPSGGMTATLTRNGLYLWQQLPGSYRVDFAVNLIFTLGGVASTTLILTLPVPPYTTPGVDYQAVDCILGNGGLTDGFFRFFPNQMQVLRRDGAAFTLGPSTQIVGNGFYYANTPGQ